MWMLKLHSPFLHSLSHTSIGTSPNTLKKGEKKTPKNLFPDGMFFRAYKGRFAGAALTQRCVLDWQVMEEGGRAAGLILPSPCLHAARCPSPSENPRTRNDDGQPSIPSKAMVPPESPKSFSCRKVSCHTPPPVALLSPIVCLCKWGK